MTRTAMQSRVWPYSVTIAAGASLSAAVQVGKANLVGIIVPSDWSPVSNLTAQGSNDGTNFFNLYDSDGQEIVLTVGSAPRWIVLPAGAFNAMEWMKLRSGTSGTPSNQTTARTLTILVRGFD